MEKMKKIYAFKALLFVAGLLVGGWFFMPWKQVGEAVLLSAANRLPGPGGMAYSTVRSARGSFVVDNLEVKNLMGMLDLSFNTLTVEPDAVASLLSMSPTCRVAFTGAVVGGRIPGVTPGNGRVVVSFNAQGVFLDSLRSDGELSVGGSLLVNPSAGKVAWADVVMDVRSEAFEEALPVIASFTGLPLHRERPGRWTLRRPRGSER